MIDSYFNTAWFSAGCSLKAFLLKPRANIKNDEGPSFIDTAAQQRLAVIRANRLAVEVWRKQGIERPKLVDNILEEVIRASTDGRFRELDKFAASLKRDLITVHRKVK